MFDFCVGYLGKARQRHDLPGQCFGNRQPDPGVAGGVGWLQVIRHGVMDVRCYAVGAQVFPKTFARGRPRDARP